MEMRAMSISKDSEKTQARDENKFHIKEDFHYSIFRIMIFRNLLY